jgi:hypothetical protein
VRHEGSMRKHFIVTNAIPACDRWRPASRILKPWRKAPPAIRAADGK